jgi:antitoxin ParD1/3/4
MRSTDSEVIRDGLRLIDTRNRAVDAWLQNEAVPAYTKLRADPTRALTGDQLSEGMAARRKTRRQKIA